MFSSCNVVLIQPAAGQKVGVSGNDKSLTIKLLNRFSIGLTTYERFYTWLGDGYLVWGPYKIMDGDGSTTIGGSESAEYKIWRWHPVSQELRFGTIENWTGGGAMSTDSNPVTITTDLTLYNAYLFNDGFQPSGKDDMANGFVDIKSWVKPFEKRTIYWAKTINYT